MAIPVARVYRNFSCTTDGANEAVSFKDPIVLVSRRGKFLVAINSISTTRDEKRISRKGRKHGLVHRRVSRGRVPHAQIAS